MERAAQPGGGWGERTAADLAGLLLELGRALKGQRFYAPDHPALRDLVDRAFLAWQVELERTGPISLGVSPAGLACDGLEGVLPVESTLRDALDARAILDLHVAPELTRASFAAFLERLAAEPESDAAGAADPSPHPGIEIGATRDDAPAQDDASLGAALITPVNETMSLPAADDKLNIDEDPLRAPASEPDGEMLRQTLLRLDACAADGEYARLADSARALANRLADAGSPQEGHRAMRVFAEHAGGQGGRSVAQLRTARTTLEEFAVEERLRELIERASTASGTRGVRAAQVLLTLGQRTVAPLLEVLQTVRDPECVAQLTAIVVALGERAQPVLREAIEHGTPECARIAVRLAGELQSPVLLDPLVATLESDRPELAREAAKALVVIGNDSAAAALARALSSRREGLPEVAAFCLGTLRRPDVVDPLLAALDRAMRQRRDGLARACIRALGQLGTDRATPKLAAIVEHDSLLQRRRQRPIKLAALTALAQLPCNEARRTLERARHSRDKAVREHALALRA